MVDVRVPIVPMSHQYVVTEAMFEHRETPAAVAARPRQPRLLPPGGRRPRHGRLRAAVAAVDRVRVVVRPHPRGLQRSAAAARPRPASSRSARTRRSACRRSPTSASARSSTAPRPSRRTTSSASARPTSAGFFVAAGFCAHGIAGAGGIGKVMAEWVLEGAPPMDLWHMDVRRFGGSYRSPSYTLARTVENYESYYDIRYPAHERTAGRPLRTSPAYAWHARARRRVRREVRLGAGQPLRVQRRRRRRGVAPARLGRPALVARRRGRAPGRRARRPALFDESSFAKIEVSGPDAARLLQWVVRQRRRTRRRRR